MCLWYLEHIDQQLSWLDRKALGYRFWHPVDHILFQREGSFGPGDRWHIVEAFGGDTRFLVDRMFHVTKLDETGFTMELRRMGHTVAHIDERWRISAAGLCWEVEMTVGPDAPGLRRVGHLVVQRRMPFHVRWRQHNVEEAGNLPQFLPELYGNYN
jgi:hypothetical protein